MDGLYCMPWLNYMIRKFILLAKEIKCFTKPQLYFLKLFAKYKYERRKSNFAQGFLDTAECRVVNTVYHNICEHWVNQGVLAPAEPLDSIRKMGEGDVISIRCPTIFTGYHFIFAIVGKNTVDIYQSYGYTRPLYQIRGLSTEEFKRMVDNMGDLGKRSYSQETIEIVKEIEEKIYGTKYEDQMKRELREINRSNGSEGTMNEIGKEEMETELFQKNVAQTAAEFEMAVYRFVESPECLTEKKSRKKSRTKSSSSSNSASSRRRTAKRRRT